MAFSISLSSRPGLRTITPKTKTPITKENVRQKQSREIVKLSGGPLGAISSVTGSGVVCGTGFETGASAYVTAGLANARAAKTAINNKARRLKKLEMIQKS